MKIMLTCFILIFFLNASAETNEGIILPNLCSIELFSKVYRLEPGQTLITNDIIRKTNCDNKILFKISQVISNSSGTVGSDFLKKEISKDFPNDSITISPRKLSLIDLNMILKDQLTTDQNLYFFDLKSLNGIKTIATRDGEDIKISCENCNSLGEKNIKVDIINPLTNSAKTLWLSTKIMAKIKVFKAKKTLNLQENNLDNDNFYPDEIFTSTPDNILTSIENIHFYKPNRTILQGSALSSLDLHPVNLINYGTPVNITLKNHNIHLQKTGMPMRSAQFGEIVELKNLNNNKIISGKVTDYNKVVIEL